MTSGKTSAGLLMYRRREGGLEVYLAHPGGPFFTHKDWGAWGIPKGELETAEAMLDAAVREFYEETGITAAGPYLPLGSVVLASGKTVYAWAFAGDCDDSMPPASNSFALEWPPKSGHQQFFPEIDQARFFPVPLARRKITPAQAPFIDRLEERLGIGGR
jgi:predicted NUDIX family NTP pyrophosphohydrolase